MAALTVVPLLGTLGIIFIGFNVLIIYCITNFNSYFCIYRL